jgi:hypothetical protein
MSASSESICEKCEENHKHSEEVRSNQGPSLPKMHFVLVSLLAREG